MNWIEARRRLQSLGIGRDPEDRKAVGKESRAEEDSPPRPRLVGSRLLDVPQFSEELIEKRAVSLCVCSGKGGTGKSVVSAALAQLFSSRGRTLVLDADLGVGNAHILQDVSPERTLVDVVEGRVPVREVRTPCSESIDLVAAGSGVPRMADLSSYEMHLIAHGLHELEPEYAYVVVDSAAGISRQTMSFLQASDVSLVVTTPDLTAMTDAYAMLKVLYAQAPTAKTLLIVNRCEDEEEAQRVHRRMSEVCERFLGRVPRAVGWIPNDHAVVRAVNHRSSVVTHEPDCEASRAFRILAVRVLEELDSSRPSGLGRLLLNQSGYSGNAM